MLIICICWLLFFFPLFETYLKEPGSEGSAKKKRILVLKGAKKRSRPVQKPPSKSSRSSSDNDAAGMSSEMSPPSRKALKAHNPPSAKGPKEIVSKVGETTNVASGSSASVVATGVRKKIKKVRKFSEKLLPKRKRIKTASSSDRSSST